MVPRNSSTASENLELSKLPTLKPLLGKLAVQRILNFFHERKVLRDVEKCIRQELFEYVEMKRRIMRKCKSKKSTGSSIFGTSSSSTKISISDISSTKTARQTRLTRKTKMSGKKVRGTTKISGGDIGMKTKTN